MSAYFTLGLADALIAVGIGVLLFGVRLRGNLVLLFLSTCIFLFGALAGNLISALPALRCWLVRWESSARFCRPSALGVWLPREHAGGRPAVTHIFPARYFVTLVKAIF
jgi:hypothetical protein